MRAVVQRVSQASVSVAGQVVGAIDRPSLLVLLGVTHDDTAAVADALAEKVWNLRILHGERSCAQDAAPILVVSQFTLYADTNSGNRPGYRDAAPGETAEPLYEEVCELLGARRGVFGADMEVEITGDGPVTITLEV